MKKWLKNTLWIAFLITVFTVMSFVESSQQKQIVGMPEIEIEVFKDMLFLTKENIIERLSNRNMIGEDKSYDALDLEKIEEYIRLMPEVKKVEVYSFISGKWKIELSLRKPIARIFNIDGTSCYLDEDGTLMPLSDNYTAHVLTVNGNINETDYSKNVEEIMNNDSLKTIEILDDLYEISNYVCSDEFFTAQIVQVYINGYNEFELIPRVGNQRILFGKAELVEGKFKKLDYFYNQGMSRAGWENYDTINVMYKSQVVCSKR